MGKVYSMVIKYLDSKRISLLEADRSSTQGFAGGNGIEAGASYGGGGGGGTGAVGGNASGAYGGAGGNGIANAIVGSTYGQYISGIYYHGGGGRGGLYGGNWGNYAYGYAYGGGGNGGFQNSVGGNGTTGGVVLKLLTSASFTTSGSPASDTTSATNYTILTYTSTSSSSLVISSGTVDVQYLLQAGGGGAGGNSGHGGGNGSGAGGGGGTLTGTLSLSAGTYTVSVGAGGAGGTTSGTVGVNGSDSVFSTKTALGGGGGAPNVSTTILAASGGCGGGGAGLTNQINGASATLIDIPLPTNVQDNSILVEKDTGRRYWFDDAFNLTGLKSYWKFNEASGDIVNQATTIGSTDSLGTAADLQTSGVTYDETGIIDKSILYNGSSNTSIAGSSVSQFNFIRNTTATATIVFWYKQTALDGDNAFLTQVCNGAGGQVGMQIEKRNTSTNKRQLLVNNYSGSNIVDLTTSDTFFPADLDWHMLSIRLNYGASTVTCKIDDETPEVLSITQTWTDTNSCSAMKIGYWATSEFYGGNLDEFSIWNRILTDAEITTIYNSGTGKTLDTAKGATWTKSLGGFALIYGGGGSSTEKFSWATKTTAGGTALAQNYEGASALCNGAVAGFFAGGTDGSYISTVFKYNYSDSVITTKGATTSAIHSWGGSWSTPTIGYVVRGNNNGGYGNTVEKYNYAGDSMSSGTSLNNGSSETTTHQTSTVGFATGRWSGSSSGDTEKYTFSSDAKTTGTSLITATSKSGAGTTTATGLIAGGQTGNGTGYQSRIEKYDHSSDAVTVASGSLTVAGNAPNNSYGNDEYALFVGVGTSTVTLLNDYTYSTGTVTSPTALVTARNQHSSSTTSSNEVIE